MRPLPKSFGLTLAATMLTFAAPAQAELINARTPNALFSLAKTEGFKPEMINKKGEVPSFRINVDGNKSVVLFMDCDNAETNCKTVQFYAGYSVDDVFDTNRINEWNRDKRFGRAYVDNSGDPVVEMDLDLDFAGLPRENIAEAFRVWRSLVTSFESFVSGAEASTDTATAPAKAWADPAA